MRLTFTDICIFAKKNPYELSGKPQVFQRSRMDPS